MRFFPGPSWPRRRREASGGRGDGGGEFDEEFEEEERALRSHGGARAWSLDDGPFKLVLIVNMQLKMGKGKASVLLGRRRCRTAWLLRMKCI